MRRLLAAMAGLCVASGAVNGAMAEPRVATDLAPVHSLASMVMVGVGKPALIVRPGASPHNYAMRPSEAKALADAEIIFWMGEELTPWLERAIDNLGEGATTMALVSAPGTIVLPIRESAAFEVHDHGDHEEGGHGHEEHGHDEHGHDEHAEKAHKHDEHGHDDHSDHKEDAAHKEDGGHDAHAHKDEHGHDEHGHDEQGHTDGHAGHGHDHEGGMDPHAWLDPQNAIVWLGLMAETLAAADPANAETYRQNAANAVGVLEALIADIDQDLAGARGKPYIVFHDAYQYFEARFDIPAAGAVSVSDATRPSAGRLREVREVLRQAKAACVFAEPQFEPKVLTAITEGLEVRRGLLDPVGASLRPGPAMYTALIGNMATSLKDCLSD